MQPTRPRVLVVDDEPDICQNLADILEDRGYAVETANGGAEALEKIHRQTFDIALLDYRMPGMDGLTLYHEIRRAQPGAVALIVTACASPQVAEESLHAGAWKVLSKPVDISQLIGLMELAVNQPAVMIVDDDVELCQNLWDLFRERSFRVCVAHNEAEVEQRLNERSYDVVLVDLKFPPRDGGEILRIVRERNPSTRLILITGHQDELEQQLSSALPPDADAYCYKPFDVPGLLETIQRLASQQNTRGSGK